jgi:tetratricopeptide (TPR) repeat protein
MKRTIGFGFLILLLFPVCVLACIQRYGTSVDGEPVRSYGRRGLVQYMTNAPKTDWAREEQIYARWINDTNNYSSYKTLSDYSAELMHLGRTREVIAILEPLAACYPGEYEINANLGTAYELDGQLEKALQFISRGIEINEDSHQGTEWVHVKILEAKIALAKNPNWLQTHSVLGYSFGDADVPVLPLALKGEPREDKSRRLAEAIMYQMRERLQFVRPPDPVVHDLLFDLGNVVAIHDVVESAIPVYRMALEFGSLRKPIIDRRISHFQSLSRWNIQKFTQEHTGVVMSSVVGIVVGLWCMYRLSRRKHIAKQL